MNSSGRAVRQQRDTSVCSPLRRGNGAPEGYHSGPERFRRTVIQRKLVRVSGPSPIGVNGRETNDGSTGRYKGAGFPVVRGLEIKSRPCGPQATTRRRNGKSAALVGAAAVAYGREWSHQRGCEGGSAREGSANVYRSPGRRATASGLFPRHPLTRLLSRESIGRLAGGEEKAATKRDAMNDLFNLIFGCRHERRSWPRSRDLKGRPVPTYEACLICGAHLPWKGLREDRQTARQAGETAECCDA